jgi:hypothetical protein
MLIGAEGAIARGYKIDTCKFDGTNKYTIRWQLPLQGAVKTNFSATIGSVLDEPVLPGLITVSLTKDPAEMQVHTFDPSGKPAARSFHIACFRN